MNNGPWNDDAMWTPEEEDIPKRAKSTIPMPPKKCPVCGSEDYDCDGEQWEEDTYYVSMYCRENSCDGKWTELYVFQSFTIEPNEPKDNFD